MSAPAPAAGRSAPPRPPYVIDTSVALKWYIAETHSTEAGLYLGQGLDRHAPDLLPIEGSHAFLKRVRSTNPALHLPFSQAYLVVTTLRRAAPIQYHPSPPLLDPAFALAEQIGASVYDGLFLALAIQLDAELVTADQAFFQKILGSPYAARARWVATAP
jgi:predicted nucleic acid-binding protein